MRSGVPSGDRACAVADLESGWIQIAKRSGWEGFFDFRANLTGEPYVDPSRLRITLPDGESSPAKREIMTKSLRRAFGSGVRLV